MERESFLLYRRVTEKIKELPKKLFVEAINTICQYEFGYEIDYSKLDKRVIEILELQKQYDVKGLRKSGSEHWNWKGGITSENRRDRNCTQYKMWRKDVFERDKFTCQICGRVGGELEAHHIEHFSENKNLRFDVDNGVTLCKECHRLLHKHEK